MPAGRRRRGLAGDGGLVLLAGLAQPGAQVDESGADHLAAGVERAIGAEAGRGGADRGDAAVRDVQVASARRCRWPGRSGGRCGC